MSRCRVRAWGACAIAGRQARSDSARRPALSEIFSFRKRSVWPPTAKCPNPNTEHFGHALCLPIGRLARSFIRLAQRRTPYPGSRRCTMPKIHTQQHMSRHAGPLHCAAADLPPPASSIPFLRRGRDTPRVSPHMPMTPAQFHHAARASCRRNSSARRNSAFAGGHILSSHRVARMPRTRSACRGRGRRKGSAAAYTNGPRRRPAASGSLAARPAAGACPVGRSKLSIRPALV